MTEPTILDERAVSEIEGRANVATKAPWHQSALAGLYIVADRTDFATIASVGEYNADGSIHLLFADAEANLEFIAHARVDIPALCATVRHLRAEIAEFEQMDLVPRSRYNVADAEAREAREQTKRLAKRAGAEIESLQSQLEQLRAENERLLSTVKKLGHNAADGTGICFCGADDRVFGHSQRCRSIRGILKQYQGEM